MLIFYICQAMLCSFVIGFVAHMLIADRKVNVKDDEHIKALIDKEQMLRNDYETALATYKANCIESDARIKLRMEKIEVARKNYEEALARYDAKYGRK